MNSALPSAFTHIQQWQTGAQAPSQFLALNLLGNLHLSVQWHLVSGMQQCELEVKVQAVLWSVVQLGHSIGKRFESIPLGLTAADLAGEFMHFADSERGRHSQWEETVVEVGEDVDILAGEGALEGGLMDAIERAGCDSTRLCLVEDLFGESSALR